MFHFQNPQNATFCFFLTTKLIEVGQRGLQVYRYRPICYYLYVFLRFYVL